MYSKSETLGAFEALETGADWHEPTFQKATITPEEALSLVIEVACEEYLTRPSASLREALAVLLRPSDLQGFGRRFTVVAGGRRE